MVCTITSFFDCGWEPFYVVFVCSPHVRLASLQLPSLPVFKVMHLISHSKLPINVKVSVCGYLSLYCWPVQGVPRLQQPPQHRSGTKRVKMDGWLQHFRQKVSNYLSVQTPVLHLECSYLKKGMLWFHTPYYLLAYRDFLSMVTCV